MSDGGCNDGGDDDYENSGYNGLIEWNALAINNTKFNKMSINCACNSGNMV